MTLLGRLLAQRDRRPLFVAVAVLVLAYFLSYPFLDVWLRGLGLVDQFKYWDFGVYGSALERRAAGEVIYEQTDQGGYFGTFLYPPATLLLFEPFVTLFEYPQSRVAWVVSTTALLVVGVQLVASDLVAEIRWWERGVLAWATLGFQPVLLGMKMGQTASLMGSILAFSYVFLSKQDARTAYDGLAGYLSGVCMGVVGFVKFAYAPTGAHLLADRYRFAGALAAGVALVATSLALFGVDLHRTYLEVLAWGVTSSTDARGPTLAAPPYYKPLYWIPGAIWIRVGASLAIAGLAVRTDAPDRIVFALGVAAFPLLTTTTYVYYFVALVPAGLVVLAEELRRDGLPVVPVVGLWLASQQTLYTQVVVPWIESVGVLRPYVAPLFPALQPGLWAVVLVAGLAFVRVTRATTVPGWVDRVRAGPESR